MRAQYLFVLIFIAAYGAYFLLGERLLMIYKLNMMSELNVWKFESMQDQKFNPKRTHVKQPKIFCIVLTKPDRLRTNALTVLYIWALKCTNYRFVSLTPEYLSHKDNRTILRRSPLNLLQPKDLFKENYTESTSKVFHAFRDIYEEFGDYYDWYLKADGLFQQIMNLILN
jgi:hypothetical protein